MYVLASYTSVDADRWGHMGGGGWGMGWMWLWGTLMMLALVAIIVGVIWLVLRHRSDTSGARPTRARDILDERYARGELTTEEYRERLEHIR